MDGYRFLSSQHLCSQLFFFLLFFSSSLPNLLLHFNKRLLSKMLPCGLIGMQDGDVLISGMTYLQFTYTICLTLLPFPWRHGPVANRRVCDVQTCTLKQSNGSAFIGIKFLTALFLLSRRTIKSHLLVMGEKKRAAKRGKKSLWRLWWQEKKICDWVSKKNKKTAARMGLQHLCRMVIVMFPEMLTRERKTMATSSSMVGNGRPQYKLRCFLSSEGSAMPACH